MEGKPQGRPLGATAGRRRQWPLWGPVEGAWGAAMRASPVASRRRPCAVIFMIQMMCLHLDVVLSYYDACSLNVLIAFQKYQSCSLALTMLVCEFRFLVTQILAPYLEVEIARLEFYLPKHIVQREMQTCENSTSSARLLAMYIL